MKPVLSEAAVRLFSSDCDNRSGFRKEWWWKGSGSCFLAGFLLCEATAAVERIMNSGRREAKGNSGLLGECDCSRCCIYCVVSRIVTGNYSVFHRFKE